MFLFTFTPKSVLTLLIVTAIIVYYFARKK